MITWILGSTIGRIIGATLGGILLSSLLYAGCAIRSCISHKAEVRAKVAEQTLVIKEKDIADKKKINDLSDDGLAEYLRSGRVQSGGTGKATSE